MENRFTMIAKTFKGLEEVLYNELEQLGASELRIENRAVRYEGDMRMLYKSNLWLRTATRVLVPIAEFVAHDADEIYNQLKLISWDDYLSADGSICIDSTVYSETFRHSKYVVYRAKDAIVDYFSERYGRRPSIKLSGADLNLNIHISSELVTLSLDSSGESLHRRGWRMEQTVAPLNEVLAAGMILMSGWRGESDFYDPMCGSGTLLIEAAMIALNIPPGIYREDFAFEHWKDFDKDLFEELYNDDSAERVFEHHIYGSDSGYYAIQVASKNVKKSGLGKYISLRQCQIQSLDEAVNGGIVIMNPPYGERLSKSDDVLKLYSEIGTALKHKFVGSTAWLISSNMDAIKNIGLKSSEKYHLKNGELDCTFLKYELFKGERRAYKAESSKNTSSKNNGKRLKKDRYERNTDSGLRLSVGRGKDSKVSVVGKKHESSVALQRRPDKRR